MIDWQTQLKINVWSEGSVARFFAKMGKLFAKQCVKSKYERKFVFNGDYNNGKFSWCLPNKSWYSSGNNNGISFFVW